VSHITLPREVVEKIREAWSSEVYPPAASIEWYDIMDALRAALDAALAEPEQPQKARPDFLAGYDAGLADGRRCAERDAQDARDAAIVAAALAEPEKKRAETGIPARSGVEGKIDTLTGEAYRTTEPPAKPEPVAWMYVNLEGECEQIEYGTPSIDDDSITLLYAAPPAAALAEPEPVHPGYIIGSHWLETAYSRIAAGEAEAEVLTEVLGARGWVKPEPATDATDNRRVWDAYIEACREFERFHGITKEDKT
jgi:hypothetical protein